MPNDASKPYSGIFPVAPTPFTDTGDLDIEGQRRVLDCMVDQGVDGVCILAGATTVPEARKRGAQNALLAARLRYAQEQGCSLAMVCALPGSQSQKNAQKNGFNVAYTRIKWQQL